LARNRQVEGPGGRRGRPFGARGVQRPWRFVGFGRGIFFRGRSERLLGKIELVAPEGTRAADSGVKEPLGTPGQRLSIRAVPAGDKKRPR
jgi:hypothetical protein